MMTSPMFAFYFTCLIFWKVAQMTEPKSASCGHKETSFVSASVGDEVTLQCCYEGEVTLLYWYKQTLGQEPRLISHFYKHGDEGIFYDEFKNNSRFTLKTENGKNNLKITDLTVSDSATYYCAGSYVNILKFVAGITMDIKVSGLNVPALVHQSASETIQPGGSVTLNCTVHTGSCDGEHSVYWFKYSGESHPGLIYSHGGRNDQCERKPDTQTHTCVYNLPMQSLNRSDAGTYYCAVASCGHILFGNGTKLDFKYEGDFLVLVYVLSGALTFATILVVVLAFSLYKISKKNNYQSTEPQARYPENEEGYQDADNLHYAAIRESTSKRSRRQRNYTENECVYSGVKL